MFIAFIERLKHSLSILVSKTKELYTRVKPIVIENRITLLGIVVITVLFGIIVHV